MSSGMQGFVKRCLSPLVPLVFWSDDEHGWQVIVGVEPGEPEDRSDIERLLGARAALEPLRRRLCGGSRRLATMPPVPAGAARKFQNCCGSR